MVRLLETTTPYIASNTHNAANLNRLSQGEPRIAFRWCHIRHHATTSGGKLVGTSVPDPETSSFKNSPDYKLFPNNNINYGCRWSTRKNVSERLRIVSLSPSCRLKASSCITPDVPLYLCILKIPFFNMLDDFFRLDMMSIPDSY